MQSSVLLKLLLPTKAEPSPPAHARHMSVDSDGSEASPRDSLHAALREAAACFVRMSVTSLGVHACEPTREVAALAHCHRCGAGASADGKDLAGGLQLLATPGIASAAATRAMFSDLTTDARVGELWSNVLAAVLRVVDASASRTGGAAEASGTLSAPTAAAGRAQAPRVASPSMPSADFADVRTAAAVVGNMLALDAFSHIAPRANALHRWLLLLRRTLPRLPLTALVAAEELDDAASHQCADESDSDAEERIDAGNLRSSERSAGGRAASQTDFPSTVRAQLVQLLRPGNVAQVLEWSLRHDSEAAATTGAAGAAATADGSVSDDGALVHLAAEALMVIMLRWGGRQVRSLLPASISSCLSGSLGSHCFCALLMVCARCLV